MQVKFYIYPLVQVEDKRKLQNYPDDEIEEDFLEWLAGIQIAVGLNWMRVNRMKYRDMSELCTCYTTLDDFQAELNNDADVAYLQGVVATTKYYKDFETGFVIKISYGYDEDAM